MARHRATHEANPRGSATRASGDRKGNIAPRVIPTVPRQCVRTGTPSASRCPACHGTATQSVTLDQCQSRKGGGLATGEQPLGPTAFRSVRDTREVALDRPVFLISIACVVGAAVPDDPLPWCRPARWSMRCTLGSQARSASSTTGRPFSRRCSSPGWRSADTGSACSAMGPSRNTATVSWVGMLFCAGIGSGLLYWSTAEWASYMDQPPFERRAGHRRGAGVGCHLRHIPLGLVGVVSLLPADRGDRVALLPVSATLPSAFRVRSPGCSVVTSPVALWGAWSTSCSSSP